MRKIHFDNVLIISNRKIDMLELKNAKGNDHIVYNLDTWPRNPTNNSNLKIVYLEQLL